MLLAGDVGGTKTLIGLFQPVSAEGSKTSGRPRPQVVREFATLDFNSLDDIVGAFLEETNAAHIDAVAIGVAGPVTGHRARLTNVPWLADISVVAERLQDCPALLLNDLEAMASAIPELEPDELAVLQAGVAAPSGNAALIAAGTGLGEALLHNINGRFLPSPSEGGHADFAARTPRELALVEQLSRVYGRVSNERVISGQGLINLFRFTHGTREARNGCRVAGGDFNAPEMPARITASALERRCEHCVETLEMFVEAYGAEAGNVALRLVATAGIYVGGGIAPKILPALERGTFMDAFRDKDPLVDLLRTLPVYVILNPAAALLGAAARAGALLNTE
jgi:glucokinase